MNKKWLTIAWQILLFAFLITLDLITKNLLDGKYIVLIKDVLSFTSTHNTGASFGIFSNHTIYLTIVSVVFVLIIFVFNFFLKQKNILYNISFVFILAGGIGNLIDRIILGYVRDFISFDLINFAIFNVADSCLTIGVILFAIFFIFFYDDKKNRKDNKSKSNNSDIRQNEEKDIINKNNIVNEIKVSDSKKEELAQGEIKK